MADPVTFEVATIATDPFVPQYTGVMAPTDEVLASRGGIAGLKVYDEIRRDPHAFAILQKLKLEVVSREWKVQAASERRIDKKAAEFVERQFKAIDFDRLTRGLLGAVLKGFSVAEVLWTSTALGWELSAVKVKKQRRFRFGTDEQLRMLTRANSIEGEPVPDRKFIVHRHSIDDDDDDPYGVGLGSVLFWPAWFKRQVLAHWLRATEKHASPTVVGKYQGGFDEKKQDQLLAAFRRMATDTGMAIPDTVEVDLLESKNSGGGDFIEKIARYLDEMMSEAVLGETLTTNSGQRGARSLGEVHNEIRIAIAKAASDLVSATLKNTLVRWIVELNFPGAALPDVYRDFAEAEDLDKKVERDKKISDMGYKPASVDYINETYGGEWVEKAETKPDQDMPQKPGLQLDFADNPLNRANAGNELNADLTDQLDTVAAGAIDDMIAAIQTEFAEARDYQDLSLRLARLSSEMGVDDLAGHLERAITLGRLEGHASVADG